MPAKSPCAILLRSCPRQPLYVVANSPGEIPVGGDSTAAAGAASASEASAATVNERSVILFSFRAVGGPRAGRRGGCARRARSPARSPTRPALVIGLRTHRSTSRRLG